MEEPGMDEFRELEADGPSDADLDAIEHGDETVGEVGIPDAEDPTMRLEHGESSTVRDYVENESPEAIAAFSEDELNQLVRDANIEEINNRIANFTRGQIGESCCVMASNLYGRQGYGSAILREDYQLQSMLSVEGNPQYEEPEVKKEPKPKAPTLTAKRNRRLRSKTRNIQLWNNKKKCFDPKYINTRFTRMSDAKDAIKRLGESMGGMDPRQYNAMTGSGARQVGALIDSTIANLMQKLRLLAQNDSYAADVAVQKLKAAVEEANKLRPNAGRSMLNDLTAGRRQRQF